MKKNTFSLDFGTYLCPKEGCNHLPVHYKTQ